MDIHDLWEKALKKTEIIRSRIQGLHPHSATYVPYILLAESSVNIGDSLVRKGQVVVEKPSLLLPSSNPQFEGFEDKDKPFIPDSFINFLLIRGIRFPSMKYQNQTESLDIYEGKLTSAIEHYKQKLEQEENTTAGLIVGPEECWQFSVLIFTCSQILKSADKDIQRLLDEYHNKDD